MTGIRFFTITEQVARHLHEELLKGRWSGEMPGKNQLSAELGVNHKTVEAALRQLEKEELLVARGAGRRRLIQLPQGRGMLALRVAILNYNPLSQAEGYMIELRHLLMESGHIAFFSSQSQIELGMDLGRIERMVEMSGANAWVVSAAPSEVLEWFAKRPDPVFAMFGRRRGLPIAGAGPDKPPAVAAATRALIALGHSRIVLLTRPARRLPEPGATERAFLGELASHGIRPGSYHLPDWKESVEGLREQLKSLFQFTPPTALIIDEAPQFVAVQQFVAGLGLRVPEDVSLVCTAADPAFAWCSPAISHIRWDRGPLVHRIVRWADNVSRGKKDLRQTSTPAEFVEGGTIGPVEQ